MSEFIEVPIDTSEKLRITSLYQQTSHDCGQTVLDMLGYDGHLVVPEGNMTIEDCSLIGEAALQEGAVTGRDNVDVWLMVPRTGASKGHWVLHEGNNIYCPVVGVMDARAYRDKYVGRWVQKVSMPVAGPDKEAATRCALEALVQPDRIREARQARLLTTRPVL